jgi:hypothetical protein
MTIKYKNLSKRAQVLFDLISKELADKKEKSKNKIRIKKSIFVPSLYRSLSERDKVPFWLILALSVGLLVLIELFRVISSHGLEKEIKTDFEKQVLVLEENLKALEKKNLNLTNQRNKVLESISNSYLPFFYKEKIDHLVDDLSRLIELSNVVVLEQEIAFTNSPYQLTESEIEFSLPDPEKSIFSKKVNVIDKSENKQKSKTEIIKSAMEEKKNKYMIKELKTEATVEMINNVPKELSFVNIKYNLKGKYTDYIQARRAITKAIIGIQIPLEEIVINKDNKRPEIRVIFDIPYKK